MDSFLEELRDQKEDLKEVEELDTSIDNISLSLCDETFQERVKDIQEDRISIDIQNTKENKLAGAYRVTYDGNTTEIVNNMPLESETEKKILKNKIMYIKQRYTIPQRCENFCPKFMARKRKEIDMNVFNNNLLMILIILLIFIESPTTRSITSLVIVAALQLGHVNSFPLIRTFPVLSQ